MDRVAISQQGRVVLFGEALEAQQTRAIRECRMRTRE